MHDPATDVKHRITNAEHRCVSMSATRGSQLIIPMSSSLPDSSHTKAKTAGFKETFDTNGADLRYPVYNGTGNGCDTSQLSRFRSTICNK